ncbi:hypothetical protein BH10PSE7_BH10PSE7_02580 [soil metagenome]
MLRLVRIILAIGLLAALASASFAAERPRLEKATLDTASVAMKVILQDRVRAMMPRQHRR